MTSKNPSDCAKCGCPHMEMEIEHTVGLREPGMVLSFCDSCISHIEDSMHPLGIIGVVEDKQATTKLNRCSHCDREIVLDDVVDLDGTDDCLCLSCADCLLEELDDFTSNN